MAANKFDKNTMSANKADKNMIVQRMEQTGDTTHIAAALAVDPAISVLILFDDETDLLALKQLKDYYVRATRDTGRVFILGLNSVTDVPNVPNTSGKANVKKFMGDDHKKKSMKDWDDFAQGLTPYVKVQPDKQVRLDDKKSADEALRVALNQSFIDRLKQIMQYQNGKAAYEFRSVGFATQSIKDKFVNVTGKKTLIQLYREIACRTSGAEYDIAKLFKDNTFAGQKLPIPGPKRVLLLWARYSGFNGGPDGHNKLGDSDVRGQTQLINMFKEDFNIITVGHDPKLGLPESPSEADIMKSHAQYHLGEFYLKEPLAGKGRGEQVSFLLALMKQYPGMLYQLGQKTGAMDAGALIGIPTLYIEHKSSMTFERMQPWTKTPGIPFYRCAEIITPPTASDSKDFRKMALNYLNSSYADIRNQDPNAAEILRQLRDQKSPNYETLAMILRLRLLTWKKLSKKEQEKSPIWGVLAKESKKPPSIPDLVEEKEKDKFKTFVVNLVLTEYEGIKKRTPDDTTKIFEGLAELFPDNKLIRGYDKKAQEAISTEMTKLVKGYSDKDAIIIRPGGDYNYTSRSPVKL